jgi:hypothetical protein
MRSALRLFLLVASAAVCAADPAQPVERPQVKPGDQWTYRHVNYWNNQVESTFDIEVTFASERAIQVVQKTAAGEIDATYTAEWNAATRADGAVIESGTAILRFPLRIGETHKTSFELLRPDRGAWQVRHERDVTVVGWEDVTVPAGTFRALRIEANGGYYRLDGPQRGTVKSVYWYAPEVKRWVKYTFENTVLGRQWNKEGEELVGFKLR